MREYIFYTCEGETIAPNEKCVIENCQVLGFSKGHDKEEAKMNLLKANPWIEEVGFSSSQFISRELVS
ncbi:MAG: hypothetical protein MJZ76_05970 [Bacteroidales bacterium]|nr:hypothetical protein [Bacteroidales bacterium]